MIQHKFAATLAQLLPQVGEWSARNFPDGTPYDPFEGMVEELGELAHARLKGRQGIRGTPAEHRLAVLDALADLSIFALDFLYRGGIAIDDLEPMLSKHIAFIAVTIDSMPKDDAAAGARSQVTFLSMVNMVGELAIAIAGAKDINPANEPVMILGMAHGYALLMGEDLSSTLVDTWAKVSQRDWIAHPEHGAAVAEAVTA